MEILSSFKITKVQNLVCHNNSGSHQYNPEHQELMVKMTPPKAQVSSPETELD